MICRTGYTGEVGVELMCPAEDAEQLWDTVVARGAQPCGLAARDTLRLEVCYPLHGNDITQDTDAISAGLGWTCSFDKEFTGSAPLRQLQHDGPARRLVAFVMEEKAVPRSGMGVVGGGVVTSGTHSPSLEIGIGLAYVPTANAAPGAELIVDVRGKERCARVVPKPIYVKKELS
jgi:aminomethyltransferase